MELHQQPGIHTLIYMYMYTCVHCVLTVCSLLSSPLQLEVYKNPLYTESIQQVLCTEGTLCVGHLENPLSHRVQYILIHVHCIDVNVHGKNMYQYIAS